MNSASETGVIRNYIETMLEMPWDKICKDHKDIAYARKVLDKDHYGLEKVKERVLEFLAVRALTRRRLSDLVSGGAYREQERLLLRNLWRVR